MTICRLCEQEQPTVDVRQAYPNAAKYLDGITTPEIPVCSDVAACAQRVTASLLKMPPPTFDPVAEMPTVYMYIGTLPPLRGLVV